jgi:hypothetical protein
MQLQHALQILLEMVKSQIEMLRISLVDLTVPETQARKQGSEVSYASYG